jgi:hypothetical protein
MGLDSLQFIRASLPQAQLNLILPFLLAVWMAWSDMRTPYPNYLLGVSPDRIRISTMAQLDQLLDGLLGVTFYC